MNLPLEITGLTKVFDTDAGPFVAVQDFNAKIEIGDFVCLLGHSGCGKSTILSILAGLGEATARGVCIDGKEVNTPGTDHGVVFQAPCLLPWLTAEKNVALAAGQAFPKSSSKQRKERARKYLEMLGVEEFCDQPPAELSLGTQQRVSLARALVLEPRFLLLDEPFGMLDSLTRFDLQDTLLQVWEQTRKTVVMVTHDIDGPAGRLGKIMRIPFARPRDRAGVLEHADHYSLRKTIIEFLEDHAHPSANRWMADAEATIQ